MHQIGTWTMDGVEGVSGPPIAPGQTFTYDFIATPGGTHWYHSHAGVQYGNGLYGPLIVEEVKPIARYDRDEILLFNDWDHQSAEQLWQELSTRGMGAMGSDAMAASVAKAGSSRVGGSRSGAAMAGDAKPGSAMAAGSMAGAGAGMNSTAMAGKAGQVAAMATPVQALATKGWMG